MKYGVNIHCEICHEFSTSNISFNEFWAGIEIIRSISLHKAIDVLQCGLNLMWSTRVEVLARIDAKINKCQ